MVHLIKFDWHKFTQFMIINISTSAVFPEPK